MVILNNIIPGIDVCGSDDEESQNPYKCKELMNYFLSEYLGKNFFCKVRVELTHSSHFSLHKLNY